MATTKEQTAQLAKAAAGMGSSVDAKVWGTHAKVMVQLAKAQNRSLLPSEKDKDPGVDKARAIYEYWSRTAETKRDEAKKLAQTMSNYIGEIDNVIVGLQKNPSAVVRLTAGEAGHTAMKAETQKAIAEVGNIDKSLTEQITTQKNTIAGLAKKGMKKEDVIKQLRDYSNLLKSNIPKLDKLIRSEEITVDAIVKLNIAAKRLAADFKSKEVVAGPSQSPS